MRLSRAARTGITALMVGAWLALPAAAFGTVNGGCAATGTATSGGVDITTATEWHLQSTDIAGGSGTAPTEMTTAQVGASMLGLALPISGGSGDGDVAGSVSGVAVETYAILGARFVVSGTASGEGGSCDGHIAIIIDDVNPLLTLLGGGGLVAAVIGLLVLLTAARSSGGVLTLLMGVVFGGLGGAGLGLALEQFGILDPTSFIGLAIAVAGAILGIVLNGRLATKPAANA